MQIFESIKERGYQPGRYLTLFLLSSLHLTPSKLLGAQGRFSSSNQGLLEFRAERGSCLSMPVRLGSHGACRLHPKISTLLAAGVVPAPTASSGVYFGENVSNFIQPNAHAFFQMKLQTFFSPSYTRSLIERREDAYILLQSFNRVIPQFARYSLSLAIGATIAGLSPDRGTALVAEKHLSPSWSSSWPQRGTGHDSTSYLEMQLGAHFC